MTLDCYYVIDIHTNKTLFIGFDENITNKMVDFLKAQGYEVEANKGTIC